MTSKASFICLVQSVSFYSTKCVCGDIAYVWILKVRETGNRRYTHTCLVAQEGLKKYNQLPQNLIFRVRLFYKERGSPLNPVFLGACNLPERPLSLTRQLHSEQISRDILQGPLWCVPTAQLSQTPSGQVIQHLNAGLHQHTSRAVSLSTNFLKTLFQRITGYDPHVFVLVGKPNSYHLPVKTLSAALTVSTVYSFQVLKHHLTFEDNQKMCRDHTQK